MGRLIFIALNTADLARSEAWYHAAIGVGFHHDVNEPLDDLWYGGAHAAIS